MEHMEKRKNMMYVLYRALLDTWVGQIGVAVRSEEEYDERMLISETVDGF